jgi:hypothetical protein
MHETPSLTKNLQSSDEYSDKPRPAETNKVSILGYQENLHPLASSEVDFRGMGRARDLVMSRLRILCIMLRSCC